MSLGKPYPYPDTSPCPPLVVGRWVDQHYEASRLSDADIDRIARRVVELMKEHKP